MLLIRVYLLLIVLVAASCSWMVPDSKNKRPADPNYRVTFQSADWRATDPKETDAAYVNDQTGEVLLANSFCNEFQSLSLERLALRTFQSMDGHEVLESKNLTFQDRESHQLIGKATVDGVEIYLKLQNLRRDHCYYDFVMINPKNHSATSDKAFDAFVSSIKFK